VKVHVTFVAGGRAGQAQTLTAADRIRIGRNPENEIALDAVHDLAVSGFHAELRRTAGGYALADLGSRNGTFVGGVRVSSFDLRDEAEISLGADGPRLRVRLEDDGCVLVPPVAANAARRRRRLPPRWLALVAAALVACLGAVGLWLALRPAGAALDPSRCGRGVAVISPGAALALRAGAASVEAPRGAFAFAGRLEAELRPDGSLAIALSPAQEPAFPAEVTLPLPPGADPADPFGPRGPVAVLLSEGRRPLLLRPESLGPDWMRLRVPHFSTVWPAVYDDAAVWMKKQGQTLGALVSKSSPALLNVVSIRRPKSFSAGADVSSIEISVQAATANGAPPDDAAKPFFAGLKVRVCRADDVELGAAALDAKGRGVLTVAPEQPGPGKPPVLTVVLSLLAADGSLITTTTVTLPAGKLWASTDCVDPGAPGKPKRFTIYYLAPRGLSDDPDYGYTGRSGAAGGVPARALDACAALLFAHEAYRDRELRDPAGAPGETDVWLQPWEESEASRYRDYIMPKTMAPDGFDTFKVSAAHELAHRFQHQYSWGYVGGWFHDASAEFLANKVFGYGTDVSRLTLSTQPDWLHQGMMSGAGLAAYGYSSFLAFAADRYGVEIGRLWPTASNASSWGAVLDAQLKAKGSGLGDAFERFARVWLVDHQWGSGWAEPAVASMIALVLRANDFAFNGGKLRVRASLPIAYLSAGGMAVSWRGTGGEGASVFGRIAAPAGKGFIGLCPGEQVSGQPCRAFGIAGGGSVAAGTEKIAFTLGTSPGAIDGSGARVVYWYTDWSNLSASAGTIEADLWAIPQPAGLQLADDPAKGKILSWGPSPLEREKELFKDYRVELRDGAGSVIFESSETAARLALPADAVGKAQEACVRARDAEGNAGPEACLSLGVGELAGRWIWISHIGQMGSMQYWVDFGTPRADGTLERCSTLIGSVGSSTPEAKADTRDHCAMQQWRLGGAGVVFTQGGWKADCKILRQDRLRLRCEVDEPFGGGVSRLTADAEKR
jgi:hypothetical protein